MAAPALIGAVLSIIDKVIPDPTAAAEAKLRTIEMQQKGHLTEIEQAASIIRAEAESGGLAASWRPILMLTFGALIVARWMGWTAPNLEPEEYLKLWDIVELGIGGYVIGRSVEKIAPTLKDVFKRQ